MVIEDMTMVDIIGFLAGILISVSIVPQIVKSLRTKKVADISLLMLLILVAGEFLWIIYGIAISSNPIIAMDGFAFIATVIMLYIKIRYKQ
jgi:MtN3 and saliva related transmembrane protein